MFFSPQQEQALLQVKEWLARRNKPFYYLAGYAGTGKTTIAKTLSGGADDESVLFGAFTGKAASVLRKSGCPSARTLHSILYSVNDDLRKERIIALRRSLASPTITDEVKEDMRHEIAALKKEVKGPMFTLNPESALRDARLLVLDECSMVSKELAEDALSFGTPILVLGDPAQLPPVKGAGFFTNRTPDHTLTEIHRQAADNPIIQWATRVRNGERLPYADAGRVRKVKRGDIVFENLPEETQVITGKNATRRELNMRLRSAYKREGPLPVVGDKLVCLKNDGDTGLLNGVICKCTENAKRVDAEELDMSVLYDGMALEHLPVAALPFEKYADPEADDDFIDRYLQQFDYGYALTVHKSQGSQWDDVVLADDGFAGWDPKLRQKWLYTAITRAAERLTIVK